MAPSVRYALPPSVHDALSPMFVDGTGAAWDGADQTVAGYVRGYLQEDILVKVDRASMAASLEVRAPFLDPDLVDFVTALPTSMKLRGFTGKYLLRRLMRGRIPSELIDRPKTGFGVPLNSWLRGPLVPAVREHLDPSRIAREGYFDPGAVALLVNEHLSGHRDRGRELWLLLQFQLWKARWLS
jgi:asparagine synthase (glutamine-hydrolysing)